VSCDPIFARAGDAFPLLVQHRAKAAPGQPVDSGAPVSLVGLESRAEFQDSTGRTLLTLSEGAGLTTAGVDGDHTVRFRVTATQTLALAPPAGMGRHDVNLALRVFDPADEDGTSRTIGDWAVTVRAREVA
jgi:hypothetical protein